MCLQAHLISLLRGYVALGVCFASVGLGATLSGVVIDDQVHRIPSVWVTATQLPADPKGPASAALATEAGPDGTFSFSGLADGYYRVCPQAVQSTWLDPCQWCLTPVVAYVAGTRAVTVTVQMIPGAALMIHVADPAQIMTVASGASILIGVSASKGIFMPARVVRQDGTGVDFQVTVPREKGIRITATSPSLRIVQSDGTAIPPAGVPLAVPKGTVGPVLQLRIAGPR